VSRLPIGFHGTSLKMPAFVGFLAVNDLAPHTGSSCRMLRQELVAKQSPPIFLTPETLLQSQPVTTGRNWPNICVISFEHYQHLTKQLPQETSCQHLELQTPFSA
jgi:hypothetical protein